MVSSTRSNSQALACSESRLIRLPKLFSGDGVIRQCHHSRAVGLVTSQVLMGISGLCLICRVTACSPNTEGKKPSRSNGSTTSSMPSGKSCLDLARHPISTAGTVWISHTTPPRPNVHTLSHVNTIVLGGGGAMGRGTWRSTRAETNEASGISDARTT